MLRVSRLAGAFAVVTAGIAAGVAAAAAGSAPVTPATAPARRIVSVVPSVTECLEAAGAADRLVGVCRYCDYPKGVLRLPKVGSADSQDAPAILALRPDLVIGGCCNGPSLLPAVREKGIATLRLDPQSLPEIIADIRTLGRAAGTSDVAERAATSLERRLETVENAAVAIPLERRLRVLIGSPRAGSWLPGPGTFTDDLIRRAGGVNAVTRKGWTAHTAADLEALRPDVVVIPGRNVEVPSLPAIAAPAAAPAAWAAVKGTRFYSVPSGWMLRPGPRLFRALEAVAALCVRRKEPEAG